MTIIATFSMLNHCAHTLNLYSLDAIEVMEKFYLFLFAEIGETDRWRIVFQPDGQRLQLVASRTSLTAAVRSVAIAPAPLPRYRWASSCSWVLRIQCQPLITAAVSHQSQHGFRGCAEADKE